MGGGLGPDPNVLGDEFAGDRVAVGYQFEHHIGETLGGGAHLVGIGAVGSVLPYKAHVVAVDGLAEVFELGSRDLRHEHSEPGFLLHP